MVKLAGCNQNHVQQLMNLWIPSLGLVQDLIDEVDWSLDLVRMSSILALNDNSRTDNLGSHDSLTGLWRSHN
jgi:hypothetical protein